MMNFMRRYGWYVFLLPVAIYILDDYETNWHDHGHERIRSILLENIIENIVAYLFWVLVYRWENRAIPHRHAECPHCHFKWLMHPKQRFLNCPHCGAPEPS
jgi:hypothetical protein